MQRRPDLVRSIKIPVTLGIAGLLALLLTSGAGEAPFGLSVPSIQGQQAPAVTPRLREVLDRSRPQERVAVLIELTRREAPRPVGPHLFRMVHDIEVVSLYILYNDVNLACCFPMR